MSTLKQSSQVETKKNIGEANEFKPVLGKNVVSSDKENNAKGVKDILTQASKYNPKGGERKRNTTPEDVTDYNKTTLDSRFAYEPSKEYKDRVKAQVHGFPSKENEDEAKKNEENILDTEGNEEFYDAQKEKNKRVGDAEAEIRHAGLKSHNLPKEWYKSISTFTENKKMKRLHFKNTEFLTEAQILKKVPEDYKFDGNKFLMRDSKGTECLIECKKDDIVESFIHVNIVSTLNENKREAEYKRIMELSKYNSGDYNQQSTTKTRLSEDLEVKKMLDRVKELMKS